MRRYLLALSLLFILVASANAKELQNGWYFSGDTFIFEGVVYLIEHYDFKSPYVLLKIGGSEMILRETECKRVGSREYCLLDIYKDTAADTHIKYSGGEAYAGLNLQINSLGTDITINRGFSKTSPTLEEPVTATITIANAGQFSTDHFYYSETFPKNVYIQSGSGSFKQKDRTLYYDSNIPPESTITLRYTFQMTNYTPFVSEGLGQVTHSGEVTNISPSAITITPAVPYSFSASVAKPSLEARETTDITLSINNPGKEEIDVKYVELYIPEGITYVPDTLGFRDGRYAWAGKIAPGTTKTFKGTAKANSPGTYNITSNLMLEDFRGNVFKEQRNMTLSGSLLTIGTTLSAKESTISEGSTFRLTFSVNNPNAVLFIRNINSTITSPIFTPINVGLDVLAPKASKTLLVEEALQVPDIEQQTTYDISASGTYTTSDGTLHTFSQSTPVTVLPVESLISVNHQISNLGPLKIGDLTNVVVKVKSTAQENLEVQVRDTLTEGAVAEGGKTDGTLYFTGPGEQVAYTYSVRIPDTYQRTDLKVSSYATVVGRSTTASKDSLMIVDLTRPEQPAPEAPVVEEPEPEVQQPELVEEEPSTFNTIVTGIVDFFRKLFGAE